MMMQQQFEIWVANLDLQFGTEAGKKRPVVIIQNNLLNKIHPSTIVFLKQTFRQKLQAFLI